MLGRPRGEPGFGHGVVKKYAQYAPVFCAVYAQEEMKKRARSSCHN